jgi:uncharacterized protein (TIGR02246 family)
MVRSATAVLALSVLLGSGCALRPGMKPERERAALQQQERAFLAALGARDLQRALTYFAEDAVLHVANSPPVHGRSAIGQFYGNVFRFMLASEATPERVRISGGTDLAYSVGRVNNVFQGGQGRMEYEGKYLLVWERRADEWLIVLYAVSSNRAEANQ